MDIKVITTLSEPRDVLRTIVKDSKHIFHTATNVKNVGNNYRIKCSTFSLFFLPISSLTRMI